MRRNRLIWSTLAAALLVAAPALAFAPALLAQQPRSPVPLIKLHNFGLRVRDVDRSVAFYQGLFGSPVQARQGQTVVLRLGDGPYFYSISPLQAGESPGITHIGLSVSGYDLDRTEAELARNGVARGAVPSRAGPNLQVAGTSWRRQRGPAPDDRHGLRVTHAGRVDLDRYGWRPSLDALLWGLPED